MADLFDFYEDAEKAQAVCDPSAVLTDDQLQAGGLRPVKAFVRTRVSRNAMRVKKHREKAAQEGLEQVNVVAPPDAREVVKLIAKRTAAGEPLEAVLLDLTKSPAPVRKVDTPALASTDAALISAAHRPGLRGWLIRRLAGL